MSVIKSDCLDFLRGMDPGSLDLIFGSPPYEMARAYLEHGEDLGIARDTEKWVAWMVEVVHESLRVCKGLVAFVVEGQTKNYRYSCGPALLIADLHRAGVHLRRPCFYHRVGIPGSGGPDWFRGDTEFIVCATNGGRLPWSDPLATAKPCVYGPGGAFSNRTKNGDRTRRDKRFSDRGERGVKEEVQHYTPPDLANPGNVIFDDVANESDMIRCKVGGGQMGNEKCHANEAPFPEMLAEVFVRSFCPPGGLTADPFSGSGTTGAVCRRFGRKFAGCDLRQSQVDLANSRIADESPSLFS